MLELPHDSLVPVVVLAEGCRSVWRVGDEVPIEEFGQPLKSGNWWLLEDQPIREMKFNPCAWFGRLLVGGLSRCWKTL